MKARDLAQRLPTVRVDDSALHAARLIATERLPGIAVLDGDGRPVTVLPASDVLRAVIPGPIQEDPSLARVLDERSADLCAGDLADQQVGDLMRPEQHQVELATVPADATVVECAAVMARLRSPLVVVVSAPGPDQTMIGLLTASHLLEVLLAGAGQDSAK